MHDLIQCKKVNFQKYVQQAHGKARDGNEMETGNENLKKKWKQKLHQSLVQCFLDGLMSSVLCHYS